MDVSFKQSEFHPGQHLSEVVPFDAASVADYLVGQMETTDLGITGLDADYINSVVENYDEQLQGYVYRNELDDLTLADMLDIYRIIPSNRPYLAASLPYRLVEKSHLFAELPNAMRHYLTLKFYNSVSAQQLDNPALSYTISLAALNNLRLGISYEAVSETDAQALARFRESDSETLPAYLFNLKPVIKLEETTVAEGSAMGMGQSQYVTIILQNPHNTYTEHAIVTVGDEIVVGVNGNGITPALVQKRLDTVDPNTAAENLHLTALHFWMEHDFFDDISAQYYGVRRQRMPSVGFFSSPLSSSYFFGIARNSLYKSRQVDVKFNHQVVVAPNNKARFEFMSDIGSHGSYLEGSVLDPLFDYFEGRGLSTTQILAEANDQHIPIYTITTDNINQILPLLQVSREVKTDIQNAIAVGHIVIIPEREVVRDGWQGSGYIIRDPITGAGAYQVEGGLNGAIINCLLCEFSKYPQIDHRLVFQVVTGLLLQMFMPDFMPIVGTNLAELGVKLTVKGMSIAMRSSAKAVARALLKKSIKRNGKLPGRGTGRKQKKSQKNCPCGPSDNLRTGRAGSNKKDEFCLELFRLSFNAKSPTNYPTLCTHLRKFTNYGYSSALRRIHPLKRRLNCCSPLFIVIGPAGPALR